MIQQLTSTQEHTPEFVPYEGKVVVSLEDRLSSVTQQDIEALAAEHQNRIGLEIPGLHPKFATEGIYNLLELNQDKAKKETYLKIGLTTGTMAKALQNVYKGQAPDQNPIAVQGMVITSDNHLVMGARSKPDFRANQPDEPHDYKLLLNPAGYAKFSPHDPKPLETAFFAELKEELGLTEGDILRMRMIGHNRDFGFTEGTRITFLTHTKLSFAELADRWKKAEHAWEYIDLARLENSPDAIKRFLGTSDFSHYSKHAKGIVEPSVRPVLTHYAGNFQAYQR